MSNGQQVNGDVADLKQLAAVCASADTSRSPVLPAGHRWVGQAGRAEIGSQGAVEGGDHIGHHLDERVINAIASPRDGIENLQEVFIEIKNWVWLAGFPRQDGRLKGVHRI
jgi:hypothetical protein